MSPNPQPLAERAPAEHLLRGRLVGSYEAGSPMNLLTAVEQHFRRRCSGLLVGCSRRMPPGRPPELLLRLHPLDLGLTVVAEDEQTLRILGEPSRVGPGFGDFLTRELLDLAARIGLSFDEPLRIDPLGASERAKEVLQREARAAATLLKYVVTFRYNATPSPRLELDSESLTYHKMKDAEALLGFPTQAEFRESVLRSTRRGESFISTDQGVIKLHQDGGSRGQPFAPASSPQTVLGGNNRHVEALKQDNPHHQPLYKKNVLNGHGKRKAAPPAARCASCEAQAARSRGAFVSWGARAPVPRAGCVPRVTRRCVGRRGAGRHQRRASSGRDVRGDARQRISFPGGTRLGALHHGHAPFGWLVDLARTPSRMALQHPRKKLQPAWPDVVRITML
jgi:hypothetical protein